MIFDVSHEHKTNDEILSKKSKTNEILFFSIFKYFNANEYFLVNPFFDSNPRVQNIDFLIQSILLINIIPVFFFVFFLVILFN